MCKRNREQAGSWGRVSDEWEVRLDVQGLTNHRTEMDMFFFLEMDFILETLGSRGSDLSRE